MSKVDWEKRAEKYFDSTESAHVESPSNDAEGKSADSGIASGDDNG